MNNDHMPYCVPVSVKGILFENDRVWLRKNERQEWELPGGKLDEGEQPEDAVVREMKEELGFVVNVTSLIQTYLYRIEKSNDESSGVLVVSYLCTLLEKSGDFEYEGEAGNAEFELFSLDEVASLTMPIFYKTAITTAAKIKHS